MGQHVLYAAVYCMRQLTRLPQHFTRALGSADMLDLLRSQPSVHLCLV